MADFQPPPTYADPVLVDPITGKSAFNPIWLKWFVDISRGLGPGGAGSGTVNSVAETFTGGLISVGGSPITSSGTLALTVAGTSGGVPYFSSAAAWASSALLTQNALVLGGGAGAAPGTPLGLGTTTTVLHGNAAGAPTWGAVDITTDVNGYSTSTYTATLTGCTTAPTVTAKYTKVGNSVVLYVPQLTATSNATTKSITGAPAAIQPAAQQIFVGVGRDNGGSYAGVEIVLETTGVINLYFNFENAWTGSGTFVIRQFSIAFQLA